MKKYFFIMLLLISLCSCTKNSQNEIEKETKKEIEIENNEKELEISTTEINFKSADDLIIEEEINLDITDSIISLNYFSFDKIQDEKIQEWFLETQKLSEYFNLENRYFDYYDVGEDTTTIYFYLPYYLFVEDNTRFNKNVEFIFDSKKLKLSFINSRYDEGFLINEKNEGQIVSVKLKNDFINNLYKDSSKESTYENNITQVLVSHAVEYEYYALEKFYTEEKPIYFRDTDGLFNYYFEETFYELYKGSGENYEGHEFRFPHLIGNNHFAKSINDFYFNKFCEERKDILTYPDPESNLYFYTSLFESEYYISYLDFYSVLTELVTTPKPRRFREAHCFYIPTGEQIYFDDLFIVDREVYKDIIEHELYNKYIGMAEWDEDEPHEITPDYEKVFIETERVYLPETEKEDFFMLTGNTLNIIYSRGELGRWKHSQTLELEYEVIKDILNPKYFSYIINQLK